MKGKILVYLLLLAFVVPWVSAIGPEVAYAGLDIKNLSGDFYDGTFTVNTSLYNAQSGGSLLYSENRSVVFNNGAFTNYFNYTLANQSASFWVEVTIEGNTLDRFLYSPAAQAIFAENASIATSGGSGGGNVSISTTFTNGIAYTTNSTNIASGSWLTVNPTTGTVNIRSANNGLTLGNNTNGVFLLIDAERDWELGVNGTGATSSLFLRDRGNDKWFYFYTENNQTRVAAFYFDNDVGGSRVMLVPDGGTVSINKSSTAFALSVGGDIDSDGVVRADGGFNGTVDAFFLRNLPPSAGGAYSCSLLWNGTAILNNCTPTLFNIQPGSGVIIDQNVNGSINISVASASSVNGTPIAPSNISSTGNIQTVSGEVIVGSTTRISNAGVVSITSGSLSTPGLRFNADTGANTGLVRIAEDQLAVVTGGAMRVNVTNTRVDFNVTDLCLAGGCITAWPSAGTFTGYTAGYSYLVYRNGSDYVAQSPTGTVLIVNTNAHSVINAAIGNITGGTGSGGGLIQFSCQEFILTDSIRIDKSFISLRGCGSGTKINATIMSHKAMINITGTSVVHATVDSFHLNANGLTNVTGIFINTPYLQGDTEHLIQNIKIWEPGLHGVHIIGDTRVVNLNNVYVRTANQDGFRIGGSDHKFNMLVSEGAYCNGIYLGASNVHIVNSKMFGNGRANQVCHGAVVYADNVRFTNMEFQDNYNFGLFSDDPSTNHVSVVNSVFDTNGRNDSSSNDAAVRLYGSVNWQFIGNTFINRDGATNMSTAISVGGAPINITVIGNTFEMNGQQTFTYEAVTDRLEVVRAGNVGTNESNMLRSLDVTNNVDITSGNLFLASTRRITNAGRFEATSGTAASPGFTFPVDSGSNTGIYRVAEDQLGITTGGTLRVNVSNTNVTISSLAGGTNVDYVCVTTQGQLFRSDSACA